MALRSKRRDRENQIMDTRLEPAKLNWTCSANSHTGPRHVTAAPEAGHMSAPDHAPCSSKILLALTGASTHVHDDVNIQIRRHLRVDLLEEVEKLRCPMPLVAFADDEA